jgi:hypothetical protein
VEKLGVRGLLFYARCFKEGRQQHAVKFGEVSLPYRQLFGITADFLADLSIDLKKYKVFGKTQAAFFVILTTPSQFIHFLSAGYDLLFF